MSFQDSWPSDRISKCCNWLGNWTKDKKSLRCCKCGVAPDD